MDFEIGVSGNRPLRVDVHELINSRALIQANSGGGKSWLLRVIAEQCAGQVQTLIIDPEGEFASLREKYDFALIGKDGEMPIDLRSAALLARKLIEKNVSTIINLSDLDQLDAKRQYLATFLNSLMAVPKSMWHPALIILDEAHKFCPEQGNVESSNAVKTLMDSGRKRGFSGILATQRLSKLHKDAAAEANNVFIGRTWLDLDQIRAGDMLGMQKADRATLRDLGPGEFYAFGPALNVNGISLFQSADVQTTHPKAGERHALTVPVASSAIREIVLQMGDLPQQAQDEADTVQALQHEVMELRRQLAARPVQVPASIQRVEVPVFVDGQIQQLEALQVAAQGDLQNMSAIVEAMTQAVSQAYQIIVAGIPGPETPVAMKQIRVVGVDKAKPGQKDQTVMTVRMQKAERRILTALAQYPEGRTKKQVAILTGYAIKGGGFNNALGALGSAGYIVRLGDELKISLSGLAALGSWEPLPTGKELYHYWLGLLNKAERNILTALYEAWPDSLDKVEIARRAGYEASGGGFNNALGKLRTLELIEGFNPVRVSASFLYEAL